MAIDTVYNIITPEMIERTKATMRAEVMKIKADHDAQIEQALAMIDALCLPQNNLLDGCDDKKVCIHPLVAPILDRSAASDIQLLGGYYDRYHVTIKKAPGEYINVKLPHRPLATYRMAWASHGHFYIASINE